MIREEIDMTLETAKKVRMHLLRVLETGYRANIAEQLIYVDGIISEADIIRKSVVTYA